jgi:hypothetical protein
MEIQQRARILGDSNQIVQRSSHPDTILSRSDVAIEHLKALTELQHKGIPTLNPLPSELLQQWEKNRVDLVANVIEKKAEEAARKSELAATAKTKLTPLSKALIEIREYKEKLGHPERLRRLEKKVLDSIHATQLNGYLESARKAEFKDQKRKALDCYYDALYFLRHDDIDDASQSKFISEIERKIVELGGEIK